LTSKGDLRGHFRALRRELPSYNREQYQKKMVDALLSLKEVASANCVMLYYAKWPEADIIPLAPLLWQKGIKTALPVVSGEDLLCIRYDADTELLPGAYDILEPQPENGTVIPDVYLVPGVAFTKEGYRLGQGGGYYDRLLKNSSAKKIGVCFGCQIAKTLPVDPWDIKMDAVVTEDAVYREKHRL